MNLGKTTNKFFYALLFFKKKIKNKIKLKIKNKIKLKKKNNNKIIK
jgi:hypothetical protein